MVAFNPEKPTDKTNTDRFLAGATSGFVTRAIVQPLDVLKIRFQLQVEPISSSSQTSKYTGMLQATRVMIAEEGIAALWKGHVPAQCLSIGYGAFQFSGFHLLTELYAKHIGYDKKTQPIIHFICGAVSGLSATGASHPFDVVRTRLVGQGEPKLYANQRDAFKHIVSTEGYRGLYRGISPNLLLIGPQAGAIFLSYNALKTLWDESMPSAILNGWTESLVCGALSGLFGKSVVYPLDSVKKRLQVQGFEQARSKFGYTPKYKGLVNCVTKVIKYEGILGLYKGFYPSLVKAAFYTAAQFSFYEYFLKYFRRVKLLHQS
ncbi:Mitochondrial thiamine pyrophosphate carrier [Halotydeus destructor]|nr:Mitochondrial thiamine pyrophosphate carrier [Halotydeus destructor]